MDTNKEMLKRIAIYTTVSPEDGGSFQYGASILSSLSRLDSKQYECRFWCNDSSWVPIAAQFHIPTILLPQKFSLLQRITLRGVRELRKLCKFSAQQFTPFFLPIQRWHPHICICLDQSYTPLVDCKIIGPVHDLMHRYEARFPEVGETNIYCSREKLFSSHCSSAAAILVDSYIGKQHVLEIYHPDPEKIFILPFVPSPLAEQAKKPAHFPLAEGESFLFYPAQMWLHKNHVNLLKSVYSLLPDLDIHCIFTGTTNKNGATLYKHVVEELGLKNHIHHLGYVSDNETRWLYEHARCMIMPSFFGPTNIPPLEAMLAGCPVGVSDIYAMRERYGEAALYFDPDSVPDIADTIRKLWTDNDLCQRLKELGTKQVTMWTQSDFEKRFLQILHQVEKS